MANSPQSRKRAKQAQERRSRNQGVRTRFRTVVKRARAAASDPERAREAFIMMQSCADNAARRGVVSRGTVSRLKRRINLIVKAAVASSAKLEAAWRCMIAEPSSPLLRLRTAQALRPRAAQALRLRTAQALRLRAAQALRLRTAQALRPRAAQALIYDDRARCQRTGIN